MPSLQEFKDLLSTSLEQAMKDYVVINHTESVDGNVGVLQACSEREVVFDFEGPNKIMIRARRESELADQTLWYLPWLWDGLSKADLDGTGSSYFSTSQLTGCRFTIQFHDSTRQRVTVMHLAGTLGTGRKKGTEARDELEGSALAELGKTVTVEESLRRRAMSGSPRRVASRVSCTCNQPTRVRRPAVWAPSSAALAFARAACPACSGSPPGVRRRRGLGEAVPPRAGSPSPRGKPRRVSPYGRHPPHLAAHLWTYTTS